MNRRRFLKLLGTAALGSGIVYSFPSVIVPKNIVSEAAIAWDGNCASPISFATLDKAYRELCRGSQAPHSIYVSYNRLQEFRNLTEGFMQFHGARIRLDAYAKDDAIYMEIPEFRRNNFEAYRRIDV